MVATRLRGEDKKGAIQVFTAAPNSTLPPALLSSGSNDGIGFDWKIYRTGPNTGIRRGCFLRTLLVPLSGILGAIQCGICFAGMRKPINNCHAQHMVRGRNIWVVRTPLIDCILGRTNHIQLASINR